jgi:hypothetical protein
MYAVLHTVDRCCSLDFTRAMKEPFSPMNWANEFLWPHGRQAVRQVRGLEKRYRYLCLTWRYRASNEHHGLIDLRNGRAAHPTRNEFMPADSAPHCAHPHEFTMRSVVSDAVWGVTLV